MPDDISPTPVGAPISRPPRTGALRVTAGLATFGIVAALVGVGVLLLPVRTPLQDCGTSMNFLLKGRTDVFGDPADPPKGTSKGDVKANNAEPCHERVAGKARIAVGLIGSGLLVTIVPGVVELALRWRIHRRARPRPAPAAR